MQRRDAICICAWGHHQLNASAKCSAKFPRRGQSALIQIPTVTGVRPYEYTVLTLACIGKGSSEDTHRPGQINVQNCRGNKPDSSYITLLRNWHIRFLFSPSLLPLFWGKKCCAETAFRKMSIMCVLAALLTWRQKEILYLEFIDSLSNILNAFFLHLHFALRTWPLQVCTIHYLLKSSSPSALISDYKHECAWSRWKGTALIQTSASLMDKQL